MLLSIVNRMSKKFWKINYFTFPTTNQLLLHQDYYALYMYNINDKYLHIMNYCSHLKCQNELNKV